MIFWSRHLFSGKWSHTTRIFAFSPALYQGMECCFNSDSPLWSSGRVIFSAANEVIQLEFLLSVLLCIKEWNVALIQTIPWYKAGLKAKILVPWFRLPQWRTYAICKLHTVESALIKLCEFSRGFVSILLWAWCCSENPLRCRDILIRFWEISYVACNFWP